MSSYGQPGSAEPSSSTRPLLEPPPSPSLLPETKWRRNGHHHRWRRWMTPVLALSTPFLLISIYAIVHPHVPGLPPLPHMSLNGLKGQLDEISDGALGCLCGATSEGERLCEVYDKEGLRASRLFEGSGARMRKVLRKARDGEPIKVGILGGSVSACHGVHPSPEYPQGDPDGPGCYTSLLNQWFTDTFPNSHHEFLNGAIGGMDSSYYAFCGTHHIADDTDLIVLEFDVNDQPDDIYQAFFDQLLRVLSEFTSQPAVVILGAWAPQVAQDVGYADPQMIHLPIAHYYDIPYISMKRLMFNHYLRFPASTSRAFYQQDILHPNARGHRILADLLIAYLESELCQLNRFGIPPPRIEFDTISTTLLSSDLVSIPFNLDSPHMTDPTTPPPGWESTFDLEPLQRLTSESRHFVLPTTPYSIPLVGLFTPLRDVVNPRQPDPSSSRHVTGLVQPRMFCADANDHDNPMTPTSSEGWEPFVWNGEKHFWVSSTIGARIRVDIKVNEGRVAVYYYRSQHYHLGDAKCWVDDNEKGAVTLAGYWTKQYNVAVVAYIDEKVTPGDHYVTCEVSKTTSHPDDPDAHNFRIVAVMAT
ncbi:hypothetical protein TREMEDRAFT_38095 [Tremella mesenterica DSM 1558]|uniref:uncharacterized protein n=1 Tax=Tremella mesenterica (strain ATCC 24925 / CBS 8224 / DSM 1558 / NBRC 9311 / NRRL Y-6157 / RJB 2259-6 / UBC 559-6) TaxID=578456 RepID=UPI0003F4939D|nr:uncharacterized protein TREMEDRAFT_38095 [Tremella mesenterica DSM 1558]EIW71857.1 hypothetical protein TREMEDRAFT_38095 [Tremella mesenterica DSM 1558]